MDEKSLFKILKFYDEHFSSLGYHPNSITSGGSKLEHAFSMINLIREMPAQSKSSEKMHRWLGFIQGVLWCEGFFTLEELKEHNR